MKANSFMYSGYQVFELRPVPKLQIQTSFEWITDDGRESINEWLKTAFGCNPNPSVNEGQAIVDNVNRAVYAPSELYMQLYYALK